MSMTSIIMVVYKSISNEIFFIVYYYLVEWSEQLNNIGIDEFFLFVFIDRLIYTE